MDDKFLINSWRECPINTYFELLHISEDKELDELTKNVKILSILSGLDEDTIWKQNINKTKLMFEKIAWIKDFSFNTKAKFNKLKLGGEKYVVEGDITKFTTAQYIDFQQFYAQKDNEKYFGNILATMIIPKGKEYADGYDVAELAEKLKEEIDIVTANEIVFFSVRKLVNLIAATQIFCKLTMKKLKKKLSKEDYQKLEMVMDEQLSTLINGLQL